MHNKFAPLILASKLRQFKIGSVIPTREWCSRNSQSEHTLYWPQNKPDHKEGRTEVLSCYLISWFYFPWNVNLENYTSSLVAWRFCVTRKEPETFTYIRVFATLLDVILRRKSSEWLELCMRFAIWNIDLVIRKFAFFKHCTTLNKHKRM